MERIVFWLESKDSNYMEGLELYSKLQGCNKNLLRNLSRGESSLNRQKLIYELKKVATIDKKILLKPIVTPAVVSNTTPSEIVSSSIEKQEKETSPLFHQLPTELRPVLLEANNLFRENSFLKSQLNDIPAELEQQALAIQIQISQNEKANSLAWKRIDHWLKYKEVPPIATQVELFDWSVDKLMYQRNLLEASISKLRKRYADNKEKEKYLEGAALHKMERLILKQLSNILAKEQQLFNILIELDGKK